MTKSNQKEPPDQYDSPWKEAIEEYFPECMAFLFPEIHADIDWTKGYQFLDKELAKVVRQALVTEQYVDKLIKVHRLSGEETWVLLHIDVQTQHETNFQTRMYQYNYRLYDRYNQPVVSLVIYGDESKKWRPQEYQRQLWGFELRMQFPAVKLIDYNLSELEQSDNPFAIVVLAHRHTKATKHQPDERFAFKWRLIRMLYERGYTRKQILSLFRYIDWLMALPPALEKKLDQTISDYEETQKMTFMIYRERKGYERGMEEGIQQGLEKGIQQGLEKGIQQGELQTAREDVLEILQIRFGELSKLLVKTIKRIDNLTLLKRLLKKAVIIESVALFEQFLADQLPDAETPPV